MIFLNQGKILSVWGTNWTPCRQWTGPNFAPDLRGRKAMEKLVATAGELRQRSALSA